MTDVHGVFAVGEAPLAPRAAEVFVFAADGAPAPKALRAAFAAVDS
jgi:hypothetical protein